VSRARIARLAALVAELAARHTAEAATPIAVAELRAAGFKVYHWDNGAGFAVDEAPGLHAKLDDLRGRGIHPPLVCVIRSFDREATA
jgi:hypothetical protein